MGRIAPIAIMIIGVVLIIGLSAAAFFVLIKPQNEALAELRTDLEEEEEVAAQLDSAKDELLKMTKRWNKAQADLEKTQKQRSIPVSFTQPITAMISLWPEYRKTLPDLITEFVETSGCTIRSGASFPAPPSVPPLAPSSGFLQIPEGQEISLAVEGSLTEIEELYRSLREFPRVVAVSSLSLSGEGDIISAQVPLTFYLLVEVPAAAVPAAGYGMPGMGMPGMGMPGMGPLGMGGGPVRRPGGSPPPTGGPPR